MIYLILTMIISILTAFIVIFCGILLNKNADCTINDLFGYRTARSMSSREVWIFANKLCAKLLIMGGVAAGVIACISVILVNFLADAEAAVWTAVGINILIAVMAVMIIPYVENKLKKFLAKDNNNDKN